jgi:hypothetical protein
MNVLRAAWIPLLVSSFVACGGAPSPGPTVAKDGFTIDAELWRADEAVIVNRASFELACPKDQVATHVLAAARHARTLSDVVMRAAQVGVDACGKRAVYVYLSQQGQWVMNTARE